jgi:hypothetical protein
MCRSRIERFSPALREGIWAVAVALGIFLFLPDAARAALVIGVNASDGPDSGSWAANWAIPTDPYTWDLPAPFDIYSSSNPTLLLGRVTQLSITLESDPSVALAFHVEAGAGPTVFTITSSTVSFPTLVNPQAFATAAVTVTDLDSSAFGATVSGLFPGSASYQAQYNGAGSVFANLVPPVTAPTDFSNILSDRFPATGTTTIAGSVSDIRSQFSFTLTANDSASGTSTFKVTPEPSSLVLALLAASCLLRQWRRRPRSSGSRLETDA